MKKIIILFTACLLIATAPFAFTGFSSLSKKASDVYLPVGSGGNKISLLELSKIDVRSFESLTGRHLNFVDRLGFKIAQKKLRKSISADGTIDNKKLNKFLAQGDGTTGFHIGGFALGFLIGLIGVLIAYLINDEKKKNRVKWAWIGFAVWIVLLIILVI
jgi:hypothetical protein